MDLELAKVSISIIKIPLFLHFVLISISLAPKESKPQTKLEMMEEEKGHDQDDEESKGEVDESGSERASRKNKRSKKKQIKSKQEAFKEFKEEDGKDLEQDIKTQRSELRGTPTL